MQFSFGSDPEFFLAKNGEFVSALGIVPNKHVIGENKFYCDNVLAECTIKPAHSRQEAVQNVRQALKDYSVFLANSGHHLVTLSAHVFDKKQLQHPKAKIIGCEPELCAYGIKKITPNEDTFLYTDLRTAGGHVHLGTDLTKLSRGAIYITLMLDFFLGVPSVLIDHDQTSVTRRKLYGNAGRYRKPDHGVEYRSIGNFWLSSPKLVELVYDLCAYTLKFVENNRHRELWEVDEKTLDDSNSWQGGFNPSKCYKCIGYDVMSLRKAIDKSNTTEAHKFLKSVEKYLPSDLAERIHEAMGYPIFNLYKEWEL